MLGREYRSFIRELGTVDGVFIPLHVSMLGLVGESTEVVAELDQTHVFIQDLLKECGDVLWYVCSFAERQDISDLELSTHRHPAGGYFRFASADLAAKGLTRTVGLMSDMVKKECWHGKHFTRHPYCWHLATILDALECIAVRHGSTLEAVREGNIEKLRARWPNGFRKAVSL
jgi:hypothetical protein